MTNRFAKKKKKKIETLESINDICQMPDDVLGFPQYIFQCLRSVIIQIFVSMLTIGFVIS